MHVFLMGRHPCHYKFTKLKRTLRTIIIVPRVKP